MLACVTMLGVYSASLAPDVTFWDAGELAAAAHAFGIPHPPGTPLWVAIAHLWSRALAPLGLETAPALNLLSAVATAAACGVTAWMVARWLRSPASGFAAAIGAGCMATIWLNATETEVYAASLLLGVLALACAERRGAGGDVRWLAAAAYCLALAGPLHLSALVVAPGVVALASRADAPANESILLGWRIGDVLVLGGSTLLALGLGSAALAPAATGAGLIAAAPWLSRRPRPAGAMPVAGAARIAFVVLLGASALLVMLVRARHDPMVNQGDPSTWARFTDVVARRQYAVAPLLPRQAPVWIQLANILQYAELQVGLGLSALPTVSPLRTIAALAWMGLGVIGAGEHRRAHGRSWVAMVLLLLAGSIGVAAQLNLKAGPTIGWGILPDSAPHEARERDYFFTVAWWAWGAWAGVGAAALLGERRVGRLALLPLALVALNWRGVTRRREPEASLPRRVGIALLESAPRGAVLFSRGDNDSYPLWYQQVARGVRRDVTVVIVPMLSATWYRAELARRTGLLGTDDVARWRGTVATERAIAVRALASGRPVAVSTAMPASERAEVADDGWRLLGLVWVHHPGALGTSVDQGVARTVARHGQGVALPDRRAAGGIAPSREPVARWARRLLNCPVTVVTEPPGGHAGPPAAQLDSLCNVR